MFPIGSRWNGNPRDARETLSPLGMLLKGMSAQNWEGKASVVWGWEIPTISDSQRRHWPCLSQGTPNKIAMDTD